MRSGAMPHLIQFGSAVRQNELCEVVEVIELREPVFALGQANNPAEQIGLRVDGLDDAQNSRGILGQGIRTVLLELLDQILFKGIPARQGGAGQGAREQPLRLNPSAGEDDDRRPGNPFVIAEVHEGFCELFRSSSDRPGAVLVAVDVKEGERDRLQVDDTPHRRPELPLGDPCIPQGVHQSEHTRQFAHRIGVLMNLSGLDPDEKREIPAMLRLVERNFVCRIEEGKLLRNVASVACQMLTRSRDDRIWVAHLKALFSGWYLVKGATLTALIQAIVVCRRQSPFSFGVLIFLDICGKRKTCHLILCSFYRLLSKMR